MKKYSLILIILIVLLLSCDPFSNSTDVSFIIDEIEASTFDSIELSYPNNGNTEFRKMNCAVIENELRQYSFYTMDYGYHVDYGTEYMIKIKFNSLETNQIIDLTFKYKESETREVVVQNENIEYPFKISVNYSSHLVW